MQNPQILKKMLEKSSQFCHHTEQPCEPKSLDVAFDIAGGERNLRLRSTRFEFSPEAGAILCSLLCSERDWNIRVGKQVYGICFIPDINLCQQLF